jgi:cephalosporin hydroxylase
VIDNRVISGALTAAFHIIWYHSCETWQRNTFLGRPILQCPLDLQLYQELVFELRPDVIIQTGVAYGGSVHYFAVLLDLVKADPSSVVVGIDIALSESARDLKHDRVRLIEGSSTDEGVVSQVRELLGGRTAMVILDSDHSCNHVLEELHLYSRFVKPGSYLIVEDTNINGHPVAPFFGAGPLEAVKLFLAEDKRFEQDENRWQRNMISFHRGGWLRRISDQSDTMMQ